MSSPFRGNGYVVLRKGAVNALRTGGQVPLNFA
jgi:hypothetical protein